MEGMVTFLTRFFPYLADCEAVRVLRYADADLLVAFRIVTSDLGVTRLAYSEPAFKEAFVMALKCAALVAKHTNPNRLVADWLNISTCLPETVRLLAEVRRRSPTSSLGDLAKLLDGLPQPAHDDGCEGLWAAWELMVPRLPPPRSVPCLYSPALKGTLQDAIHGFYLKDGHDRHLRPAPSAGFQRGLEGAFLAAATAACHPNPDAQAKLLVLCSCEPMIRDASSLLQGDSQLSSEDVRSLARLLCPQATSSEQPLRPFLRTWYLSAHTRMSKKVNAALSAYAVMPNGEPMYELHTICGVNNYVSGPVGTVAKCYRSHVNFLATPKGTQFSAGKNPVLFFAEVSNDDKERAGTQSFCCSVSVQIPRSQRVRCLFCDYMGIKIVHPVGEDFHDRKLEFEKMVCGEDPCNDDFVPEVMQPFYTNIEIIEHSQVTSDRVNGRVEEDCLYNDPNGDSSDGYDSDLTLLSNGFEGDLGSMDDDYPPYCRVTSCCRHY
ncbi:unnamed protein product [Urochloa decumbens]|uniref:Uncharacterized protein n=1 Tax=Urochloa decumbens TaxID=240449 RepID=A0ABC9GQR3_9POAL